MNTAGPPFSPPLVTRRPSSPSTPRDRSGSNGHALVAERGQNWLLLLLQLVTAALLLPASHSLVQSPHWLLPLCLLLQPGRILTRQGVRAA